MNDTKSKVYIVQNVMRKQYDGTTRPLNYEQAERFGEIIFLFDNKKIKNYAKRRERYGLYFTCRRPCINRLDDKCRFLYSQW